ncbi:MAG: NAD(P)-dependent oxidoreductase, partial [bacterium]
LIMKILITGAAGNLGSNLARHLLDSSHELKLLIHNKELPQDITVSPNVSIYRANLDVLETLVEPCKGTDCIVHFAGVLFAPYPEKFLPKTNIEYVRNLLDEALAAKVGKFILVSFPHVEGETFPEKPATGRLDIIPASIHAHTRLKVEKILLASCGGTSMAPVILRAGMIYGKGILMIEAARWLLRHRLLAVWKQQTWVHILSLPDFISCVVSAIEQDNISGIYNLGDDQPLTLQEFLDTIADYWGYHKPWRFPRWSFYMAACCCEAFATVFRTKSPLTRDFIKIGMASYVSDTTRMKDNLLPKLTYPSLKDGLHLLDA